MSGLGRTVSGGTYAVASAVGLAALLYPLWSPTAGDGPGLAPLALALLVGFCLVALAVEASTSGLGARRVAALGVLVAIGSALRFAEVAVPGPGGFSPVFLPIIVSGAMFGARFGFLLGAMTLAVSAVITGGVTPWLPAQMLVAGWVGMTAGWLPRPEPGSVPGRGYVTMLAAFGAVWGLLYGFLLTPWSWLYYDGGVAVDASAGAAERFLAYYLATSLAWDAMGSAGNVALLVVAGAPALRALGRLGRWLDFDWLDQPAVAPDRPAPPVSAALRSDQVGPAPVTSPPRAVPAPRLGSTGLPSAVWIAWIGAVAVVATVTRNPIVLLIAWLAIAVVGTAFGPSTESRPAMSAARLAALVLPISALYGLLALHSGSHVLLRLPTAWPLIGGPLTLEGLVFGACGGLALLVLYAGFAAFQRALGTRGLVRLVPRAFASLGLASAIAMTQLPASRRQSAAIREAWLIRGNAPRGLQAWRALAIPLLVGGLERSLQLAESLAARGLASADERPPMAARVAILTGLALVAAGWVAAAATWIPVAAGAVVSATGAAAAGLAVAVLTRRSPRTDHRALAWSRGAVAVTFAAMLPLVALATPTIGASADWTPFPHLAAPGVDPILACSLAFLAAPAVAVRRSRRATAPAKATGRRAAPPRTRSARPVDEQPSAAVRLRGASAGGGSVAPTDRQTAVLVERFSYRYPTAATPALSGLDLRVGRGGITLITGPSGSGKSTLLRALAGLVPHFTGGTVTGSIYVAGAEPIRVGATGMAGRVGLVSGDPEGAFVMDVVGDEVAFALEQRALSVDEIDRRVASALADVGLPDAANRPIASLSGGERQRVAIATAMAARPEVLLLDEPTSQLDDRCADDVLAAVQHLVRSRGVTVIVTEHRLGRVLHAVSDVVTLPARNADGLVSPDGASRGPATAVALPNGEVRLDVASVAVAYGGREVLRGASLTVRSGEVVLLTGASGSGKTTLLRTAVGLLAHDAGHVTIDGNAPARDAGVFRRVGYLAQDPSSLLLSDTVSGELALTLKARGREDRTDDAAAILSQLGLSDLADAYPRDLSTGQRQRLALAAIAVGDPILLILDEPTRGLDDGAAGRLAAFLRRRADAGAAILVASHDCRLAAVADRRLEMVGGRILLDPASG